MKFNVALKFRVNGQDNKLFDPVGGDDKRDVYLYTGNEMHSVMSFLEDIYIFTENEKDAKSQAREEKRKIESYPFAKTFPNRTQVSLWHEFLPTILFCNTCLVFCHPMNGGYL